MTTTVATTAAAVSLGGANYLHDHPDEYDIANPEVPGAQLARFAAEVLRRWAPGRQVLDVGCGPGRELARLTALGFEVDGLDGSPAMVARARSVAPDSRVDLGLTSSFDLERRYDAIVCLGSTLLYNHTDDDLRATMDNFFAHLRPGGVVLLEMRNGAHFLTADGQRLLEDDTVHSAGAPGRRIRYTSWLTIDHAKQILDRRYRWVMESGEEVVEHIAHRLVFPRELDAYLRAAGLTVLDMFDEPAPALGHYGEPPAETSRDLTGRRLHVIARRPVEQAFEGRR